MEEENERQPPSRGFRIAAAVIVRAAKLIGVVMLLVAAYMLVDGWRNDSVNREVNRAARMSQVLGGPANFIEYEKAQ
ncbi:putative membrane protein [Stenotrophomonas phage Silvanus]|nr:putative membrane protein [Stenotrophomonas phage Silvanus]